MSASLCGGIGSGPVASGSGSGATLALTLTRAVPCDSVIYIVYGLGTFHTATYDSGSIANACADTFGHTYVVSTLTKCLIGAVRQNIFESPTSHSTILMGSAIAVVNAGEMANGDVITLTFTTAFPASMETVAAVFAVTGILDTATPQSNPDHPDSSAQYFNGDNYPDNSSVATTLNWLTSPIYGFDPSPQSDSAFLTGALSWPDCGVYTPADSTLLGQVSSTNMGLAVSLKNVLADSATEPGGSWASPSTALVGNYQFADLLASTASAVFLGSFKLPERATP